MAIKKKDHEKLDDANIERVIALREAEKPITIKAACEILNIASNGARLQKIIDEYKENKSLSEKRRAANRGKPASEFEIQACIEGYLDGDSISDIAKRLYRSAGFVKQVIETIGVPSKTMGHDYFHPQLLPDNCIASEFDIGQVVWNTKYNGMSIVLGKTSRQDSYKVFNIELIEEVSPYFPSIDGYGGHHAVVPAFDLGNLEHLKEYGIDIYKPYRSSFPRWLAGR